VHAQIAGSQGKSLHEMHHFTPCFEIAFTSFVDAQSAKKSKKKSAAATKVVDSGQTLEKGVGYLNKPESFFEAIPAQAIRF
jgi:hypothetical protein